MISIIKEAARITLEHELNHHKTREEWADKLMYIADPVRDPRLYKFAERMTNPRTDPIIAYKAIRALIGNLKRHLTEEGHFCSRAPARTDSAFRHVIMDRDKPRRFRHNELEVIRQGEEQSRATDHTNFNNRADNWKVLTPQVPPRHQPFTKAVAIHRHTSKRTFEHQDVIERKVKSF